VIEAIPALNVLHEDQRVSAYMKSTNQRGMLQHAFFIVTETDGSGPPDSIVGRGSSQSNDSSPSANSTLSASQARDRDASQPVLLRHAHDYGYSNSDPLTSMGMLTKVPIISFCRSTPSYKTLTYAGHIRN
jgi:hypothetical protein